VCTTTRKYQREFKHNLLLNNKLWQKDKNGGGGIRTPSSTSNSSLHSTNKTHTKQAQKLAESDTYKNCKNTDLNRTSTSPEQDNNTFLHKKCAICVHQIFKAGGNVPQELSKLIYLWPKLPKKIKQSIKKLVGEFETNGDVH
jgi:hypothetical protein